MTNSHYTGIGTGPAWPNGADMDDYDAHVPLAVTEPAFAGITGPYRAGARKLVRALETRKGERVLDFNCRTGMTSLETFMRYGPEIAITATEQNPDRIIVAKYKFHHGEAPSGTTSPRLQAEWDEFRKISKSYKDSINFLFTNLLSPIDKENVEFKPESIDHVLANLAITGSSPERATAQFKRFHELLKTGGDVLWNGTCGWYTDGSYPAAKHYFMQNVFLHKFLDNLHEELGVDFDYKLPAPGTMTISDVKDYTGKAGFETAHVGTFIHGADADFQTLITRHLPGIVDSIVQKHNEASDDAGKISAENRDRAYRVALAATVVDTDAMNDWDHKVNVVPIFRSVKK